MAEGAPQVPDAIARLGVPLFVSREDLPHLSPAESRRRIAEQRERLDHIVVSLAELGSRTD